ncbi:hypothetical protein [Variovorax sp. JS1663]|uniref:hypothetical protein n=1 Tax=Variovorax sp. JS1663 TaxID=1851577 RepID=UPI000B34459B|nr:hypothetical protein [Variovorax sp. JS1663]OUM04512.1 hypothetical protein A8M77_02180 [Variovorax sp. JS1663]
MSSFKTQALLRRVAAPTGPERSFWKAVGALAQEPRPNWGLDLHAGRQPLATDAFVYLVDTSNVWIAAAAISPAQLVAVRDEVEGGDGHELRARAAVAMASASQAVQPKEGSMASPETLQAFAAGLRAIAAAPGFIATAEQSPELDNYHWILLLYRRVDGEVVAGFGYVDEPIPGMLDRETLVEFVGNMVEMDLTEDTSVGVAVREHGGVDLAAALSHVRPA